MPRATYRTGARVQLLSFFEQNPDQQFTADELSARFSGPQTQKPIAKSTLYRQLDALCREGLLQRFDGTDPVSGAAVRYYQPIGADGGCRDHFHLKCLACGALQHLECEETAVLLRHLAATHAFSVDSGRSILYGLCQTCRERQEPIRETPDGTLCPCGCGKTKHRVKDYGMV